MESLESHSLVSYSLAGMIAEVIELVSLKRTWLRNRSRYENGIIDDNIINAIGVKKCVTGIVCAYFGIKYECKNNGRRVFCVSCSKNATARYIIMAIDSTYHDRGSYFIKHFGCNVLVRKNVYMPVNDSTFLANPHLWPYTKTPVMFHCHNINHTLINGVKTEEVTEHDITPHTLVNDNGIEIVCVANSRKLIDDFLATSKPNIYYQKMQELQYMLSDRLNNGLNINPCSIHFCRSCTNIRCESINSMYMFILGLRHGSMGVAVSKYLDRGALRIIWSYVRVVSYQLNNDNYSATHNTKVHYAHVSDIENIKSDEYIRSHVTRGCPTIMYHHLTYKKL